MMTRLITRHQDQQNASDKQPGTQMIAVLALAPIWACHPMVPIVPEERLDLLSRFCEREAALAKLLLTSDAITHVVDSGLESAVRPVPTAAGNHRKSEGGLSGIPEDSR
jgi:hypothetical protein